MRYDFLPASCPAAVPADHLALEAATAAYLGRYRGTTRLRTESDLRIFLTLGTAQDLDPLTVGSADIERHVRRLQDVRCYQPSTISRRLSADLLLPGLCDRPALAALAGRLRPPAPDAARVADPRTRASAV